MSTEEKSSGFQNYPFLTREEFAEACHQLDRRYRQATLGPLRVQWRLNVLTALDTSFALDSECSTYVQIVLPLEGQLDDGGLSAHLHQFSFGQDHHARDDAPSEIGADQEMADLEEADNSALHKHPRRAEPPPCVTYEVHLHPTYRGPCLWFSLQGLPADEPALDLDTVFRRLVPDHFKARLRNPGPIGGISVDHHPITGVPCFFIHPCLLRDAMSEFDCSREDYMMVWLGLVGGCVGLWVPREMASV